MLKHAMQETFRQPSICDALRGVPCNRVFLPRYGSALPPSIVEAPEPLTLAVVTSRATLRCRVFGAPRPEVKWMKETQELTGGRYKVLDSGDLQIDDLLVTDQGEYTCYASNKFGDASASGALEVKGESGFVKLNSRETGTREDAYNRQARSLILVQPLGGSEAKRRSTNARVAGSIPS